MVLELDVNEIWDFLVNGENIIFLVHYILFTYSFMKLPFNIPLSAAIGVHVSIKVCNLISTKIWNLKFSNLKPIKHPTRETFEIWENSLYHFLSFCPNFILGNLYFHNSFNTRRQVNQSIYWHPTGMWKLREREGKFGIKKHISSKCMKSKIFLILIWLTLKWESWVSILPIFPYQPMKPKKPI